jgi:hypothetical protein
VSYCSHLPVFSFTWLAPDRLTLSFCFYHSNSGLLFTPIDTPRPRTINRHHGLLYLLRPVLHKGRASRTTHSYSFVPNLLILSIIFPKLTLIKRYQRQTIQMLHMSHVLREKVCPLGTCVGRMSILIILPGTYCNVITQCTAETRTNKKSPPSMA